MTTGPPSNVALGPPHAPTPEKVGNGANHDRHECANAAAKQNRVHHPLGSRHLFE